MTNGYNILMSVISCLASDCGRYDLVINGSELSRKRFELNLSFAFFQKKKNNYFSAQNSKYFLGAGMSD